MEPPPISQETIANIKIKSKLYQLDLNTNMKSLEWSHKFRKQNKDFNFHEFMEQQLRLQEELYQGKEVERYKKRINNLQRGSVMMTMSNESQKMVKLLS